MGGVVRLGRAPVGRAEHRAEVEHCRLARQIRLALQEVDRDQPRSQMTDLTLVAAEAMGAVSHHFAAALAGTPGVRFVVLMRVTSAARMRHIRIALFIRGKSQRSGLVPAGAMNFRMYAIRQGNRAWPSPRIRIPHRCD